jgi:hypothetical protein
MSSVVLQATADETAQDMLLTFEEFSLCGCWSCHPVELHAAGLVG